MPDSQELIAILGLSDHAARYSNRAMQFLKKHGYRNLIGVHPRLHEVEGVQVVPRIEDIPGRPHTLTVYLDPEKSEPLIPAILKLRPQRIILNPGAESERLAAAARAEGIEVAEACTLVLLQTGQF